MIAGKVAWSREESLANIVSVEMVDLPLSKLQAEMEDFGSRGGRIIINRALLIINIIYTPFPEKKLFKGFHRIQWFPEKKLCSRVFTGYSGLISC